MHSHINYSRNHQNSQGTTKREKEANWKIFNKHPNANAIAEGLDSIPSDWVLTPVRDKRPYRKNWHHEEPVSHGDIKTGILKGNRLISNKGKPYTAFDSGYGLRLGDVSGGLIAVDVDGESAGPLLEAISGGNLPETVAWTSGKAGRYQLLFKVPNEWRDRAAAFTRAVLTEHQGIKTKHTDDGNPEEILELRYNEMQSVLPPSYHPSTGSYKWINSPEDTEVANAPQWLLNWLVSFGEEEARQQEEQKRKQQEREQRREERTPQSHGFIGSNSGSKEWERHKRGNPCPVCGGTKHCRTNKETGLIHCRGDNPSSDYQFLKEDKWGFRIFKHKDDIEKEKNKTKKQQREEKRRQREERDRQRKEQLKQQLTIEERDKAIRRLLSQLNLNATDREKLRGRGLTDDQINEAGYRSVSQWQELDGITVALAGINRRGNLNNPWDGILIPIPNEDGLWVGMRLHDPNAKGTGNAKYIWLSSPKSGKTPHYRNGENPIAVYYPSQYQHYDRIGLCEGLEWKPKMAAERLGYPVIGFSGSHFDSSPETLKATLSKLQGAIGNSEPELRLIADGGIAVNPHVTGGYRSTAKLLEGWGYTSSILDWGQLTDKTAGDIDEISSEVLESAKLITATDFIAFPDPDFGREKWAEPDPEEYKQHEKEEEEEAARVEAEKERDQEIWKQNYPIAAKKNYKRLKQFAPDIRINTPLLQKKEIEGLVATGQATCIRSPMGTGKTLLLSQLTTRKSILKTLTPVKTYGLWRFQGMELNPKTKERLEVVEAIKDAPYCLGGEKWRSLGYRNNLLIQSSKDWGMIHLPSAEAQGRNIRELINQEDSKTSGCIDSLTTRYKPEDFDGCNLVLDECNAIVTHLLTAKTEVSRRLDATCEMLAEALQRAKRVFIMDALLTDSAIAYLRKLAPNKNFIKIQNDYKNPTNIVNFTGTEEEVEGQLITRKNKRAPLVDWITLAGRPVICSDSQVFCAATEAILNEQGMKGVRLDSETSGESWAKECMENPNEYILKHLPDYFIYSPSLESGNSVTITGYFDQQFAFFFGAINTDSAHQMMFRVRDLEIQRFFWCKEFDSNSEKLRSPFPRTNLRNHKAMLLLDIQNCFEQGEDVTEKLQALSEMNRDNPHHAMWGDLEAIYSYEKSNLRQCLVESLEDSGHQITEIAERDLDNQKLESKAKDEVKDRYASDIFNAQDIDASEIDERKQKGKWTDQCAVAKKVLKMKLPDIEKTHQWDADTVRLLKYDKPDHLRKLERYWMLNNLEGAKKLQRQRWGKVSEGIIHKYHLRSDYSKILALIEAGIEQFLVPDKEWKADDPEVQQFIKNCQKHNFKLAFGASPSKKSYPMRWIGRCLDFFGCDWRDRRKRIEGTPIQFYRVKLPLENDMRNPIFFNCISQRLLKAVESIDSEKSSGKQTSSNPEGDQEVPNDLITTSTSRSVTTQTNTNLANSKKSSENQTSSNPEGDPPLHSIYKQTSKGRSVNSQTNTNLAISGKFPETPANIKVEADQEVPNDLITTSTSRSASRTTGVGETDQKFSNTNNPSSEISDQGEPQWETDFGEPQWETDWESPEEEEWRIRLENGEPTPIRDIEPDNLLDYNWGEMVWYLANDGYWTRGYVVKKTNAEVMCSANLEGTAENRWIGEEKEIKPGAWEVQKKTAKAENQNVISMKKEHQRPPKKGDIVLLKSMMPRSFWLETKVLGVKDKYIEVDVRDTRGKRITRWLADSIAYPDEVEAS